MKEFLFENGQLPAKSVLFIFECGYKNIKEYAYPILTRYRIPALIFLVVNHIGDVNRWGNEKEHILTIDDISELNKSLLVTFGLQSKSNNDLTSVDDEQLTDEIIKSKAILEEIIRYNVDYFNYPQGKYNINVVDKLREADIPMAFIDEKDKVTKLRDYLLIPSIKLSQADSYWKLLAKLRLIE